MSVRSVSVRLSAEVSGYVANMRAAGKATKDALGDATKFAGEHKQSLSEVGATAGKIGLAAAAGLGAVVYASANFDKGMSAVQAATHETTQNMDLLREAALQAGADTAFSATEAAAGVENLAKAGVSTADILGGGLAGALDLAAAGSTDVAFAAETAATAMTQFGLSGDQVPHIADLLAAAAGKAQGEVSDMAMALKQSGLVANQMGLSLEESTGALASFASAGLLGSDAGTSFKTMLMRLLPQSKEAGDAMESIGFSAFNANGEMKSLTDIAGGLRQGLSKMTDEQRQATLATIFGQDAIRAATVLYEQGADGIEKWINKVDDQGYAAETAALKLDNLKGDVEEFTGSLETFLINSGDGSQTFFRSLVQGATDGVNALNDLPPVVGSVATGLLGVTAITGGGLWFGSKVLQGVSDTRAALRDLGVQGLNTRSALLRLSGVMTGLVVANSELAERTGLSNTAAYALMGTIAGPWGAAIGGGVGLAKDFAAANNDLADALTAANDAADAQSIGEMRRALQDLRSELVETLSPGTWDLQGNFELISSALTGDIDESLRAIDELERQIRDSKNASGDLATIFGTALAPALGQTVDSFDAAAQSADDFIASLERVEGLLSKRGSFRSYRESIRDMAKALEEAPDNFRRNGPVFDELQGNLDGIAENALEVAKKLSGMDRVNFLDKARGEFIKAAVGMDISRDRAAQLATQLGLLDKEDPQVDVKERGADDTKRKVDDVTDAAGKVPDLVDVLVQANTSGAMSLLSGVAGQLASLDGRTARTYVTTIYSKHGYQTLGGLQEQADGGAIAGQSPHPRADNILVAATAGEHMWSVAEVQAAGGHARVERLRRMARAGLLRGYADGGPIGGAQPTASLVMDHGRSDLAGLSLHGRLDTPWGPADVVAIVDDRIDANRRHDRVVGRRR